MGAPCARFYEQCAVVSWTVAACTALRDGLAGGGHWKWAQQSARQGMPLEDEAAQCSRNGWAMRIRFQSHRLYFKGWKWGIPMACSCATRANATCCNSRPGPPRASEEAVQEALCAVRDVALGVLDELLEPPVKVKRLESVDSLHRDACWREGLVGNRFAAASPRCRLTRAPGCWLGQVCDGPDARLPDLGSRMVLG